MRTRVLLATRNAGKVEEMRRILAAVDGLDVELVGLDAFPDLPDVAETGATFSENALLKAHAAAAATGLPSIADDSGLAVDALNGMPGVLSARWAGRHGDDRANLELLLAQLVDVPDEQRRAEFVCAAATVRPGRGEHLHKANWRGSISRAPRGTSGFGYDPIFVPGGYRKTSAELTAREKDAISHRGKVFRSLAAALPDLLR